MVYFYILINSIMKQLHANLQRVIIIYLSLFIICLSTAVMAQEKTPMYRVARIQVDPAQLDKYNVALKEQMNMAIRVEPGVLSYYAVADKKEPSHITIFEVYADSAAYNAHVKAPHFRKYKETVQHMVTALEVVD